MPFNPDAAQPTAEAIAALDNAGQDVAHAEDVFAAADDDVRRELETEQRLVSDSGTQVASTKAALSTESPRPTVVEWLEDGLSRTTGELEHRFEPYREKIVAVGKEVGDGIREIVEAWLPLAATLRIAATTTRNVVAILQSSPGDQTEIDGEIGSAPPDFDYVEIYIRLLRGERLPDHWAPFVKQLDFQFESNNHHLGSDKSAQIHKVGGEFGDLGLISECFNLTDLNITGKIISDIRPLLSLTKLERLHLTGTQVLDISPIEKLKNLRTLFLTSTPIVDLSPIASLPALESAYLADTRVADLSPLGSLTSLQTLSVWATQVSDLGPLTSLKELRYLDLWSTPVSNVDPLASLTALRHLDLSDTLVSDINPLIALTELQHLDLTGTQVSDVTPLAALTELQYLDLTGTQVSDVTPLAALNQLQHLGLRSTQLVDASPLAALTELRTLDLTNTPVTDVSMLSHIGGLEIAGVEDTLEQRK